MIAKERIMQFLRNDVSNVLSYELWICMEISKISLRYESLSKETMFKKEKCFKRNYVLESKEIMFKSL